MGHMQRLQRQVEQLKSENLQLEAKVSKLSKLKVQEGGMGRVGWEGGWKWRDWKKGMGRGGEGWRDGKGGYKVGNVIP